MSSSQALQIGGGSSNAANPSFAQQGSVDWVSFGNSTISASLSVMQRLSAAGVQPVTVAGGLALGSRFELSKKGARNMDMALQNLSGKFGYSKLLYYGFGYRSFVHVLTETTGGVNLVALCACLGEIYGIKTAADVLAALWKLEAFPEQYEPALSQFNSLVTACAGVVTCTTFSQIADIMLGDVKKLMPGQSVAKGGLPRASISNTDDIAKALQGLFQLSKGNSKYMDVVGGANCCFIAAFASWLLDLTIYVEDVSEKPIHQGSVDREASQVRIRYCELDRVSTDLQITSKTYVLRHHEELILNSPWKYSSSLAVRTPWDGCLERVFWRSMQTLKKSPHALGEFFGSIARISAAFALSESTGIERHQRHSKNFYGFAESSYGQGYVESIQHVLPELWRIPKLPVSISLALDNSFDRAYSNFETSINTLGKLCDCPLCNTNMDSSEMNTQNPRQCLVITALVINRLIMLVANLKMDNAIDPTITGLQSLYDIMPHKSQTTFDAILDMSADLPTATERIADVELIFTGNKPDIGEISKNTLRTAYTSQGICFYIEGLCALTSQASALAGIHVLPGKIQRGDREYDSVWDCPPAENKELTTAVLTPRDCTVPQEFRSDKIDVTPMVTELSGGGKLIFYYQASFEGRIVRIRPGMLTAKVLQRSGLVSCNKRTCKKELVAPCSVAKTGWKVVLPNRQLSNLPWTVIWPFQKSDLARCVLIEILNSDYLFIRQRECFPCCTEAIYRACGDEVDNEEDYDDLESVYRHLV